MIIRAVILEKSCRGKLNGKRKQHCVLSAEPSRRETVSILSSVRGSGSRNKVLVVCVSAYPVMPGKIKKKRDTLLCGSQHHEIVPVDNFVRIAVSEDLFYFGSSFALNFFDLGGRIVCKPLCNPVTLRIKTVDRVPCFKTS